MNKNGYTLIEVLISILLFGLIVLLVSYAISQGLYQYRGVILRTANFWEMSKILLLHKSFASTIDYYVKDEDWFPLFEGESNSILYITESPIAEFNPVIALIIIERKELGKKTLVYYELPIHTLNYKDIQEISNSEKYKEGKKIVLFKNLESVTFEYYGGDMQKESLTWYSNFSGKKQKNLPQFVKIILKFNEKRVNLTFSVKSNSLIKNIYNEIY